MGQEPGIWIKGQLKSTHSPSSQGMQPLSQSLLCLSLLSWVQAPDPGSGHGRGPPHTPLPSPRKTLCVPPSARCSRDSYVSILCFKLCTPHSREVLLSHWECSQVCLMDHAPVVFHYRWHTQGPQAESSPPPCFYPAAAPSSRLTVKE